MNNKDNKCCEKCNGLDENGGLTTFVHNNDCPCHKESENDWEREFDALWQGFYDGVRIDASPSEIKQFIRDNFIPREEIKDIIQSGFDTANLLETDEQFKRGMIRALKNVRAAIAPSKKPSSLTSKDI